MEKSKQLKLVKSKQLLWLLVVILFLILVGGGFLLYELQTKTTPVAELLMGVLIVFSVAALMTILFVLALGYGSMNLNDPKQALGLPKGSIRAMIALMLIMMFILISIFLFRRVSLAESTYMGDVKQISDVKIKDSTKMVIFEAIPPYVKVNKNGEIINDNNYYVYVQTEVSEEGRRLAQQLITTLGTLVAAIASFYFGTTMSKGESQKESESSSAPKDVPTVLNPIIKDITPKEGKKGQEITMEILGSDFKLPKTVQLLRGSEVIAGTEILSNSTKINCKIMVDKEPDGKWDVIVSNDDGKQAKMAKVFTIKQT